VEKTPARREARVTERHVSAHYVYTNTGTANIYVDVFSWCLSIVSSWGTYGYRWDPEMGRDFRRFLCSMPTDALYDKLMSGREEQPDLEATGRNLGKLVGEKLRTGAWTRREAERELDRIRDLRDADGSFLADDEWREYLESTKLECAYEHLQIGPCKQLKAFLSEAWPHCLRAMEA